MPDRHPARGEFDSATTERLSDRRLDSVRYRFVDWIGRGGEGEIHLVEDLRRDGARVALKILARRGVEERAPTEFRHLASLRHRSLARVFDSDAYRPSRCLGGPHDLPESAWYFTSEYCPGTPIHRLPPPFSWDLFESILLETCEVLAYLNTEGYRHGDLKPSHLIFDSEARRLRVIDLGQIARLDGAERTWSTLPYAPPEIWEAGERPRRNSDLYSLGMIALQVATGRLPIRSESLPAWRAWHRHGNRDEALAAAVALPDHLRDVIRSCLSPDPADRPPDAWSLARELTSTVEFATSRDFPPAFVGRERDLRALLRWARGEGAGCRLLVGASEAGLQRLASGLMQTMRVDGCSVLEAPTGGPLRDDAHDLTCWMPTRLDGIEGVLARCPSRTLVVVPLEHFLDASRGEMNPCRWIEQARDRGIRADCQVVTGLDASSLADIARDIVGVATRDHPELIQDANGLPGRLVTRLRGGDPSPLQGSADPALRNALSLLPIPVGIDLLEGVFGRPGSSVWSRLLGDPVLRLCVDRHQGSWVADGAKLDQLEITDPEVGAAIADALDEATSFSAAKKSGSSDGECDVELTVRFLRALARRDADQLSEVVRYFVESNRAVEASRACRTAAACWGQLPLPVGVTLLWVRALYESGQLTEANATLANAEDWEVDATYEQLRLAAKIAESVGDPRAALRRLRLAGDCADRSSENFEANLDRVRIALSLGHRDDAVAAVEEWERTGGLESRALDGVSPSSLSKVGSLLYQLGHVDRSREFFARSLRLARRSGRDEAETALHALSGLAAYERSHGSRREALRLLRTGVRYASLGGIPYRARHLELNYAGVLYEAGLTAESEQVYRRLFPRLVQEENVQLLPFLAQGLGTILREKGDLVGALRTQLRGLRVARESANDRAFAGLSANVGELYLLLGDPRSAYRHRLVHLRIAHRLGDPRQIRRGRFAVGAALCRRGRLREAAAMLDRAATAAPEDRLSVAIDSFRAETAWLDGDSYRALRYWATSARRARETGRTYYRARAIAGLARIVAEQGRVRRAAKILDAAWQSAAKDPDPRIPRLAVHDQRQRMQLSECRRTGTPPPETLITRCFETYRQATRAQLAEEALSSLLAGVDAMKLRLGATEPTDRSVPVDLIVPSPGEVRRVLRRFRRRLGEAERATLCRRFDLPDRFVELLDDQHIERPDAEVVHLGGLAAELRGTLRRLSDRWSATDGEAIATVEGRRIVWARFARRANHWVLVDPPSLTVEVSPAPTHIEVVRTERTSRLRLPVNLGAEFNPGWISLDVGDHELTESGVIDLRELETTVRAQLTRASLRVARREAREYLSQLQELRERPPTTRGSSADDVMETEALTRRIAIRELEPTLDTSREVARVIVEAPSTRELDEKLDQWADTDLPVLVHGESGVGKSLWIRRLHARSDRREAPLIVENCSALPEALLEAELFGYVRGAFTGADRDYDGILARSDGATLVLDHLDEMPIGLQSRLLLVLENRAYRPLGSEEERRFETRLMTTCRRSPREAVETGALRSDLLYRVSGIPIEIPPLRDRRVEIDPLLREYLRVHASEAGRAAPEVSSEALDVLESYRWPGNVRELDNLTQRWIVGGRARVDATDVEQYSQSPETGEFRFPDGDWREATAAFQRELLRTRLARNDGNQSKTATELGLSRRHLQNLLDKLGLRDAGEN